MDGSPSSLIMLGLGNGTFDGSPGLVLTLGLGIGEGVSTTLVGTWSNVMRISNSNERLRLK